MLGGVFMDFVARKMPQPGSSQQVGIAKVFPEGHELDRGGIQA
jgi:hypothetical protein